MQPQPNAIQPQPTPFTPFVGRVTAPNGEELVVFHVKMVTGDCVLFMPPEAATQIGNELVANGRGAASGLVLPPGVKLPVPPPHTNNGHKQ